MNIICELDGVLADTSHVEHLRRADVSQWYRSDEATQFYEEMLTAPVNGGVTELIQAVWLGDPDIRFVISTARPDRYKPQTIAWLANANIRHEALFMRPGNMVGTDWYIKDNNLRRMRKIQFFPVLAVDCDPKSLEFYASKGIETLAWNPANGTES